MYWCVAQIEQNRTHLAWHTLTLAGYKVYEPLLREQRRSHGRKIVVTTALFPGYLFIWVVKGWWDARWAAGVRCLIMDGERPAVVRDQIIDEIRSREVGGFIVLPKRLSSGLKKGQPVKILRGAFEGKLALYDGMAAHERVLVLLDLLGRHVPLNIPTRDIVAASTL